MEINKIAIKISEKSKEDKTIEALLKEIYMYQRTATGNYKATYRSAIQKYAIKEDGNEN